MKNALLVTLSTFPFNKTLETYQLEISTYQYKADQVYEVKGTYQLDPIPALIAKMDKKLDYVILLASEETFVRQKISVDGTDYKNEVSPVVFFKNNLVSMDVLNQSVDESVKVLRLDVDDPSNAIRETSALLTEWSKTEDIHLYIDTHGGFRGTQLLIEAVLGLLVKEEISTTIFSVKYYGKSEINYIVEDKTVKAFDFVSGINEFINYGRIDSLFTFLNENEDRNMVNAIQEISEGIQWCNLQSFDLGIRHLRNYFRKQKPKNNKNVYLQMFEDRIKTDYGSLLDSAENHEPDEVEIVKWCLRKGFYQQTLTIIESRISTALIRKHIIEITPEGEKFRNRFITGKNKTPLSDTEIFNGCLYKFAPEIEYWDSRNVSNSGNKELFNNIFGNRNFVDSGTKTLIFDNISDKIEDILLRYIRSDSRNGGLDYKWILNTATTCSIEIKKEKYVEKDVLGYGEKIENLSGERAKNLTLLLFMHKTVKDIRNNANHILKSNFYHQDAVKNAILYYLWLIEKLS